MHKLLWICCSLNLFAATRTEALPRATLELLPNTSLCPGKIEWEVLPGGQIRLRLQDLGASKNARQWRVSCRIAGTLSIPAGYQLAPDLKAKAFLSGTVWEGRDLVGGRLKLAIDRLQSSSVVYEIAQPSPSDAEPKAQRIRLRLETALPPLAGFCAQPQSADFQLTFQGYVNGALNSSREVSAQLQAVLIDPLELTPLICDARGRMNKRL